MSEKRFELHSDEDTINIIDLVEDEVFNFQFDVVSLSDAKILVLRLNRLAEENEKLNSEMKINLKEFSRLFKQNLAQKRKINDLQEENEQLRKENERQNNEIKLLRKKIIELREDLEKIPPSIRGVWLE